MCARAKQTRRIGWIGLGTMGLPMALRLADKSGCAVYGCDIVPSAMDAFASMGGIPEPDSAALLENSDVVFLSLPGNALVQETLTDAFLEDVRAKGTYLRNQIEALDLPCFGATRGMGLMIGIQVKDGWTNKEIASKLIENGLLVLTAGPGMRLLPPLVISQEEMDQGLEILKKTLS